MGRYNKQRERKTDRYFKKKYPKYPSGVQFAETQPEPGGYEVASKTTQWAQTGGQLGGPAGAAIGAGLGLAKSLYDRKKIKEANRQIRAEKEAYDDFGGYATDPKLMSQEMIAKNGIRKYKKGVIEIEGKRGIGEIHTDKNYNVKSIGTKPHTQGGDKVVATEGDIVFDTQGDAAAYRKIMGNIKRYKMGSKAALKTLEKERAKLPAETAPKKGLGDGDVIPPTAFGVPQEIMDNKRGVGTLIPNDTPVETPNGGVAPFAPGMEPTGTNPFEDPKATPAATVNGLPEGVTPPSNLEYNPKTQRLNYNANAQSAFDKKYSDNPYLNFLLDPNTQAKLGEFRAMEAEDPKGAYGGFQKFMQQHGMDNTSEYMDYLRMQGFDPGGEGYGEGDIRNYEGMTLDSSLRFLDQYNKDNEELNKNLFSIEDLPVEEDITPPEVDAEVADEDLVVDDEEPTAEGKKKKKSNLLRTLGKNANVISNMIDANSPIEGYQKSGLKLDRYKYQDMSAPKIAEANKAAAVRRNNRRQLVGSKGQNVSLAAQDEVMVQQAKERIFNDEIATKLQVENANVDITNLERKAGYSEDIRAKDIERMQRAAKRQFGRAAMAEIAQLSDLAEQKDYMMQRDDKLYARDAMLANILGTRSYDLKVSRNSETGEYNPDVDLDLRPEYKQGKKVNPKKTGDEEVEEKEKGSRKIKFNTKRYK